MRSLAVGLVAVGCGSSLSSTTSLTVADPSRVALLAGSDVALPAGGSAQTIGLGSQTVELAPGGQSEVGVSVLRTARGELAVRWDTRLPLVDGEQQLLVPTTGLELPLQPQAGLDLRLPPLGASPRSFHLDACARLSRAGYYAATNNGRTHASTLTQTGFTATAEAAACPADAVAATPLALETGWDNVVIHRRVTRSSNARDYFFTAGGVAAVVGIIPLSLGGGGGSRQASDDILIFSGTTIGLGVVLALIGLAFPHDVTTIETLAPDGTVLSSVRAR